eukprot:UN12774
MDDIDFHGLKPKVNNLPIMGSVRLSLCGGSVGANMQNNKEHFEQNEVTYQELCENPSLVFDGRLIVLSQGQLYPGRVALPLLLSYLAFKEPLSETALWKLATQDTLYKHVHYR